ncbi:hypothetical protein FACS1894122_07440 [Alphaproteobacteria bacterium]|nr:hypothetical protein FACS1894122_07440 [Alphaproteobacteria bacterium]
MDDTQERFAPPPSFDSMPTPEQFSSLPDFPRFDMPPVAPQFVEDPVTLEKRRKAQEEYRKAQEEYNLQCRKALEKHGLQWSEEPDRTSSPLFWRVSWGRSPYVEPEWKSSEHMQEIRAIEGQILNSLDDGKIDIGSKTDMRLHTPLMCYLGDVFWNTYVQSISNGKSRAEAIDSFIGREDDNVAVAITDNVAVAITNDSKFLDEVDKQIAEKKATPSS